MTVIDDHVEVLAGGGRAVEVAIAPDPPAVAAVATPPRALVDEAPSATPEAIVLRGFVVGALVGAVVVFAVCAGISLYAGSGWGPAIGIGAFAAFWGGPGFGGMLGAVSGFVRAYEHG